MSAPLVSIIIANYNKDLYLRDCLDSILSQSYRPLEIIFVDDYSSDTSVDIIMEYKKKHPEILKCFFNSANIGVTKARHQAILNASGPYITTLDSDDYYYDSQKLEKEMNLLSHYREKKGQDIIAFSNIMLVKGDKTLISVWGNSETIREGNIFAAILGRSCLIPRDFLMTREAYFQVGGYDLSIPIYEDWDLKIRLAAQYHFYYSGTNGTAYRRHGNGLSAAPIPDHEKWLNFIFEKNSHLATTENIQLIRQKFTAFLKCLKPQRIT